jgi:hypothetical protein
MVSLEKQTANIENKLISRVYIETQTTILTNI